MNNLNNIPILHLNTADTWRGGEKQTFFLTSLLHKRGYLSYCVCLQNSPLHNKLTIEKLPCFPVKVRSSIDIFAAIKISQIAKQVNAKILHMHTAHAHSLGYLCNLIYKVPINIVSRRVDFRINKSPFSRIKYNFPDRFITVSGAIKEILIQDNIPSKKISVVHSGIDFDSFKGIKTDYLQKEFAAALDRKKIKLVNVAALTNQKDHETLIKAVDIVRKEFDNFILFIVGEGELQKDLEKLRENLKLENHIIFTGFRENSLSLIKFGDIFIMSSRWEGLGTSIIDAMASGKPVIASRTGGIPELIRSGENGLLVPKEDPKALAEAIINLIKHKDLREKYSSRGQRNAMNFSIERTVDKTIDVYMEMCNLQKR
jgi:L-malate glycosyltransferase